MTRPALSPATRPFRLSRAAVLAHRQHGPTPLLGCAVCMRRGVTGQNVVRWSAPRQV